MKHVEIMDIEMNFKKLIKNKNIAWDVTFGEILDYITMRSLLLQIALKKIIIN